MTDGCTPVPPAPWHVDPVSVDDDRRIRELIEGWEARTGESATKAGTIRRAVRHLWDKEIFRRPDGGGDQGA